MRDLSIGIQLVRIVSSVLQQGEVNLEKSAITLKYAMDAERILPCPDIILWCPNRVMCKSAIAFQYRINIQGDMTS